MNCLKFFWPEGGGEDHCEILKACKLVLLRDVSMPAQLSLLKFPFGLPMSILDNIV